MSLLLLIVIVISQVDATLVPVNEKNFLLSGRWQWNADQNVRISQKTHQLDRL
jgi:hypothetical protein